MASESRRQPVSPILREERIRSFHLPFFPPSPDYTTAHSGHPTESRRSEESFDTISSVSFAEMSIKPTRPFANSTEGTEDYDVTTPLRPVDTPNGTTRSTRVSTRSIHNSDRISIAQLAFALQREEFTETTDYFSWTSSISRLSKSSLHSYVFFWR
jgi:hypothetical protein